MAKVAARRTGGGVQLREAKGAWTVARRAEFLAELARTMNVRQSARAAGLSEQGAYKLRKRDAGFANAWAEALSNGYDKVELLLLQRAIAGLDPDAVAPGDTAKLEKLSERTLLGLMAHHRQTVREHREAMMRHEATALLEAEDTARAQLTARLDEIAARLGDEARG